MRRLAEYRTRKLTSFGDLRVRVSRAYGSPRSDLTRSKREARARSCQSCSWPHLFVFTQLHTMVVTPMLIPVRSVRQADGPQHARDLQARRDRREGPADTRRINLWFMPDSARESVPDHLGVLGRIAAGPKVDHRQRYRGTAMGTGAVRFLVLWMAGCSTSTTGAPHKPTTDFWHMTSSSAIRACRATCRLAISSWCAYRVVRVSRVRQRPEGRPAIPILRRDPG